MSLAETFPTRASLIERLKDKGDEKSWRDFFDRYWRLIYNFAIRAGLTDAEAQDVVQDTIISVARNIEEFRYRPSECSFRTWLLRTTRWRISNQLKRRQRELQRFVSTADDLTQLEVLEPAESELEKIWMAEWAAHLSEIACDRVRRVVSPQQYQIYDLYVNQEWPVARIKTALNVSATQIYLAKHRVGALLKRALRDAEAEDARCHSDHSQGYASDS